MPFNTFANKADPYQAAILPDRGLLGLTSNFFVLCTIMKFYLYNHS